MFNQEGSKQKRSVCLACGFCIAAVPGSALATTNEGPTVVLPSDTAISNQILKLCKFE